MRWHRRLIAWKWTYAAQPPLAKINSERDNPMNWSDIFTAPAALYACHVAVVRVPVAVQLMQTSPAALSSFSWPHEHKSAA